MAWESWTWESGVRNRKEVLGLDVGGFCKATLTMGREFCVFLNIGFGWMCLSVRLCGGFECEAR